MYVSVCVYVSVNIYSYPCACFCLRDYMHLYMTICTFFLVSFFLSFFLSWFLGSHRMGRRVSDIGSLRLHADRWSWPYFNYHYSYDFSTQDNYIYFDFISCFIYCFIRNDNFCHYFLMIVSWLYYWEILRIQIWRSLLDTKLYFHCFMPLIFLIILPLNY